MTHIFLKKRWVKVVASVTVVILLVPVMLRGGIEITAATWEPWEPDYEAVDILPILMKDELTDEDYEILYEQTGLTKIGIDDLLAEGNISKILDIQESFFAEPDYYCKIFHFCVGMFQKTSGNYPTAILKDGDVIVSPATFISFVKLSHAAIVVDADSGRIAEAYGYGTPLGTIHKSLFFTYPAFVILRPKAGAEVGEAAAEYVKENMLGTPYDILTGIISEKAPETIKTTHCSHLPWYAYYKVGVDIDSNGGSIVTPNDILYSDEFEVVQVFGMDINDFR